MEKFLTRSLTELFRRSYMPLRLSSRFVPETRLRLDGVPVRADIYEWSLTGNTFRLELKRTRVNGSFFSKGGEKTECFLNGRPAGNFTVAEIERLLHDTGWRISPGIESEETEEKVIERTEEGKRDWHRSLPYFRPEAVELILDYFPENEGSYVMTLAVRSEIPIDSDRKLRYGIGFRDWRKGREPSDGFRLRLIEILRHWSPYITALGYEETDLVDYYTILDAIVEHPEGERQHCAFPKMPERGVWSEEKEVTPRCFSWWREGFTDSQEERGRFFSWYERTMSRDDRREEALKAFGLSENPSAEEIRKAYRKKIRAFHPDAIGSKGLDPAFLSFAERESERLTDLYEYLMKEVR